MIGSILKDLLEKRNIRVGELARRIDVPATTLYSIIKRDNMKIDFDLLLRICRELDAPIELFCGGQGSAKMPEPTEWSLIRSYRELDDHGREMVDTVIEKLRDPAFRAQVKAEMDDPASDYENFYLNSGGWEGVSICSAPETPLAEGKSIARYAREIGKDPFEAYFDLVVANRGVGTAVYHSISDEDIFDIIRLPYVMVGSDGLVGSPTEKCHPRGWGTMARALCLMTKENQILPLEELIHRNTGFAAKRFKLANKGLIQEGYDADLVLFDYENLQDNATYANPTALATGIDRVWVNGQLVYTQGHLTGATPGKLL